ncbi:hypothetical protein A2Y83_03165 [Candidatus Falkowbacteria bacterium RBG_13_39_14]|uniref:Permease n=1 Tax=Candidatus Falkowbacteria bacterium RBG_13_39_14 TaxID=1797985 RepID=A0A1F5S7I3_9BACT|nr:MAG: hypothetical protein A2Y83_03165 [Candidatus Falkowbacteria bacterium RBG_13_39_14]
MNNLLQATKKSAESFKKALPIMAGILMLISLINLFAENYYTKLFTGNIFIDPLIGAVAGSVAFGIPLTSYIVGGELLKQGVSLFAVTAFIMTWATVGIAMLPLEASFLGKKFAISRNIINFIFAIIIAILTVWTMGLF